MSKDSKDPKNPFNGLNPGQCQQIHQWYQDQIAQELAALLKNSQSGLVLEKKISHALTREFAKLSQNQQTTHAFDTFSVKNACLLSELKDTRAILQSAQRKIGLLEQQSLEKNNEINVLEEQKSKLNDELRSYRKRLNQLLQKSEIHGVSYLKSHFVGRIFVHALKSSFADWQQTNKGERFKNKDFYSLFPRVLYSGLLKELEILLGETDYSRINQTVSSFVFQQKGMPVQDWSDDDPIYETPLINQKQSELLRSLRTHHERRKNFASYLEKKLEKTGFTPMHGQLLIELIQFATTDQSQAAVH